MEVHHHTPIQKEKTKFGVVSRSYGIIQLNKIISPQFKKMKASQSFQFGQKRVFYLTDSFKSLYILAEFLYSISRLPTIHILMAR